MKKIINLVTAPLFLYILVLSCSSSEADESETIQFDSTPPIITLIGESTIEIFRNSNFVDPGATAYDDNDGNLSSLIQIIGYVLTDVNGEYIITYRVSDAAGNTTQVDRTVIVYDDGNPLVGDIANGGVVFWVNPDDNTHGLVAAINCESPSLNLQILPWRPDFNLSDCRYFGPYSLIGNTEIGGGLENTNRIIALNTECDRGEKTNYAAYFARNYKGGGYNDWYLPNLTEVELFNESFSQTSRAVFRENCDQGVGWEYYFAYQNTEVWSSNGVLDNVIASQRQTHATAGIISAPYPFYSRKFDKLEKKLVLPIRAY